MMQQQPKNNQNNQKQTQNDQKQAQNDQKQMPSNWGVHFMTVPIFS